MYGYIYITTNLVNGKQYIGKHVSSQFDENYKGSGILLWKAISKYGWDNFKTEILKECISLEDLNQSEVEEIANRDAVNSDQYYNLAGGGKGDWSSQWVSNEFRRNFAEQMSGDRNPAKRPEVQAKMRGPRPSISGSNNPNYGGLSEINRKHISESRIKSGIAKGERNPMYGKRGKESPHYGKIHVNNGINYITIPADEYEDYQKQGYTKTRNPGTKDYCYMNNGVNSILINKTDASLYESAGWLRGKSHCPITHEFERPSTIESIAQEKDLSE